MKRDQSESAKQAPENRPIRVNLPGFLITEEIGLGDAVKKATGFVHINPCAACLKRAARLNQWMRFTSRH